jgi:hypothetical protein
MRWEVVPTVDANCRVCDGGRSARDGSGVGWKSSQFLQAVLDPDPPLVREHEQGHRLLLAPPCDIHHSVTLPGLHLLQPQQVIQLHHGIVL